MGALTRAFCQFAFFFSFMCCSESIVFGSFTERGLETIGVLALKVPEKEGKWGLFCSYAGGKDSATSFGGR